MPLKRHGLLVVRRQSLPIPNADYGRRGRFVDGVAGELMSALNHVVGWNNDLIDQSTR
jgi:hypothetical protein